METLLTISQVAKRLGLSYQTIKRMVDKRDIPVIKVGRSVRIDPLDLDKMIAEWRETKPIKGTDEG
jgi:excisionase family DNA binding protein